MKKAIMIFLTFALCLGALEECGKNAVNTPSTVPSTLSDEELQMLRDLQFDDYRQMTIAEFQNEVWKLTEPPAYSELLSRLSKDEELYALRDSDETAAFLYDVLEPLTKEKWQSHTYRDVATSDVYAGENSARLEYIYTMTILKADRIRVKDYCDLRMEVRDAMNSMMLGRMKEQLQSEEYMLAEIDTFVEGILPYFQTPEMAVAIEYVYFPLPPESEEGHAAAERGIAVCTTNFLGTFLTQRRSPWGSETGRSET